MTRRQALASLTPALIAVLRQARGSEGAGQPLHAPRGPGDPGDLTERFRQCDHGDALDVAAKAIRGGADLQTVLGAVYLAGVLDIRPRHVGGKLHAVQMVESAFQLAEASDSQSGWLLALWNLDDFKRSQDLDRAEGEWVLPPRPDASFATEGEARREFLAAMDAWDDQRADRALVGLLAHHDLESIFEILWPLAARSYVDIGHKMIFAAQTHRVLRRIGGPAVEPALRSLVYGLLYRPSGSQTEVFEHGRELAASLPAAWLSGKEAVHRSRDILQELRRCGSREAQRRIVSAFKDGMGPCTVWDGLRLLASELFLRRLKSRPANDRAALLPVHPVTVVNAFGHAWRTTRDDTTRRLVILQAGGWLPALRDDLAGIVGLNNQAHAIDALGGGADELSRPQDEPPRNPTPISLRAWLRDPKHMSAYRTLSIAHLARKAAEHHQHKYAAALFEESRLAQPEWSPRLLACAAAYLPDETDPETELYRRSLHALRDAGTGTS